ncbi:hypothetical protein [Streptomyces chryseus]|uniref:hypothetical protein n=1 Tax=Streptomyces chryseus TaxID=68186 RepID=UPI00110FEA34|nr:hypothetical protein [Streptomyces chryseus]GGX02020.1 hypothetical protein GCM10010353_17070 [Streptomyces chryseus]
MALGRRKNETTSSSTDAQEAAARLPKTLPSRVASHAVPDNPHSRQYSALTGGYTNSEQKPVPGTPKNR